MTFDPNIPQANQRPSVSQGGLLINFAALNTVFAIDHLAFNAVNGGKHNQSTYLSSGGAPGTLLGEGCVYVDNSGGTRQYAYYQRESAGASIPFSMIGGFANITGAGAIAGTSFNFAAPAHPAVGNFTLTFTNAMMDANYVVAATPTVNAGTNVWSVTIANKTAAGFAIRIKALDDSFRDPDTFSIIVMGELA